MEEMDFLSARHWHPFAAWGYTSPYLLINLETVLYTWYVLLALFLILFPLRYILKHKRSVVRFIALSYVKNFIDLIQQALGPLTSFQHISFVISLFTFILICNLAPLIPGLTEPTKDINTTLALGIISFLYTHGNSLYTHGIVEYLKEYMRPFFVMFPLHVAGQLATVVSLALRLFGNIFGGFTISHLWSSMIQQSLIAQLAGLFTGINLLIVGFFVIFEGFLQAFVFSILSLTYLSLALSPEGHDTEPMKDAHD